MLLCVTVEDASLQKNGCILRCVAVDDALLLGVAVEDSLLKEEVCVLSWRIVLDLMQRVSCYREGIMDCRGIA